MPDDINDIDAQEEKSSPRSPKKKKSRKGLMLFVLLLLIAGGAFGLSLSGLWDARPLFYALTPKIPYVGEKLSKFFDIPEIYTLTVEERRVYELRKWQDSLSDREQGLKVLDASLQALSRDLSEKQVQLDQRDKQFKEKVPDKKEEKELSEKEKEVFDRVIKTYREISARRAAKIMEKLTPDLAVKIIESLPEEDGAKILGRMDAARAAWLTEQLTKSRQ